MQTAPATNEATPPGWDKARAHAIIDGMKATEGAALPMLHALQEAFGYVPHPAEAMMAEALNLSRAEIRGIISFYHDFRQAPAGRHVMKLCVAEACQSMGGPGVAERLLTRLGIGWGETTTDGSLTVEKVYCLGLCACAPAALLDDVPVGRLDDDTATLLAAEAAGGMT